MGWAEGCGLDERGREVRVGAGTRDRVQSGARAGLWVLQSLSTGRGAAGAMGRTDWTVIARVWGVKKNSGEPKLLLN